MVQPLQQTKGFTPLTPSVDQQVEGLRGTLDAAPSIDYLGQPATSNATVRSELPDQMTPPPVKPLDTPGQEVTPQPAQPLEISIPDFTSVLGALTEETEGDEDWNGELINLAQDPAQLSMPELEGYTSVLGKIYQDSFKENIAAETQSGSKLPETVQAFEEIRVSSTPSYAKTDIIDESGTYGKNWNFGTMKGNSLVVHHTAGRGDAKGIANVFKERGFPAHFVIDREGKTHQILGINQRGRHTRNSQINDVTNANSWGVEVIAKDDSDITPKQAQATVRLSKFLNEQHGMPLDRIFGHGEINRHKQKTEGSTIVNILRNQM